MNILRMIAYALVITGAIVWGLVGFFNFDPIAAMFGDATLVSRIIYSLVGIGGVVMLLTARPDQCYCESIDSHF